MTCWNCGKRISKDIPFCPHCGKEQSVAKEKTYLDKDPFEVLQISKDAEEEVIKAAYRSLARKYHPDTNPTPEAEEIMKEITWAFELLSDKDKRQQWKHRTKEAKRKETQPPPKVKTAPVSDYVVCGVCGERYDRTLRECPVCRREKAVKAESKNKLLWFVGIIIGAFIICVVMPYVFGSAPNHASDSADNLATMQKPTATKRRLPNRTPVSVGPTELAATRRSTQTPEIRCFRYDQLTMLHVGRETCVYGRIVKIQTNLTADGYPEYVIRFSIPDHFLFKSIYYYAPGLTEGKCIALYGEIEWNGQYYFMRIISEGDVTYEILSNCD